MADLKKFNDFHSTKNESYDNIEKLTEDDIQPTIDQMEEIESEEEEEEVEEVVDELSAEMNDDDSSYAYEGLLKFNDFDGTNEGLLKFVTGNPDKKEKEELKNKLYAEIEKFEKMPGVSVNRKTLERQMKENDYIGTIELGPKITSKESKYFGSRVVRYIPGKSGLRKVFSPDVAKSSTTGGRFSY